MVDHKIFNVSGSYLLIKVKELDIDSLSSSFLQQTRVSFKLSAARFLVVCRWTVGRQSTNRRSTDFLGNLICSSILPFRPYVPHITDVWDLDLGFENLAV